MSGQAVLTEANVKLSEFLSQLNKGALTTRRLAVEKFSKWVRSTGRRHALGADCMAALSVHVERVLATSSTTSDLRKAHAVVCLVDHIMVKIAPSSRLRAPAAPGAAVSPAAGPFPEFTDAAIDHVPRIVGQLAATARATGAADVHEDLRRFVRIWGMKGYLSPAAIAAMNLDLGDKPVVAGAAGGEAL